MVESHTIRESGHPTLLALVAVGVLTACQFGEVQEPWVSGDQYEQERSRSAETWNELRHRAMYNQIDR